MSEHAKVAVEYRGHCDYDGCDLGVAEYKCPACGEWVSDYGKGWFGRELSTDFPCAECGTTLSR